MNYRVIDVINTGADFFLGVCVLSGAALVFYRSRRAALFIAIAGLAYCLGVGADWLLGHTHMRVPPATIAFLYNAIGAGRHLLFFGGLALGLRAVALEAPR